VNECQPSDRIAGATEIVGAVRRTARVVRAGQARIARLLADGYGWEVERIAESLDVDCSVVGRLLAADGIRRCVDCSFALHRSCMGALETGIDGAQVPCECDHTGAD